MFRIKFETDNAAFKGRHGHIETVRILREIAEKIVDGHLEGKIRDVNGNTIGEWSLTERGM